MCQRYYCYYDRPAPPIFPFVEVLISLSKRRRMGLEKSWVLVLVLTVVGGPQRKLSNNW